ncbi:hypothetical protein, partial [Aeromonas sp. EERV15]|uniref:hypothetical protein n=1 Tax=Aeromonas sp. EERV15 TaxID=1833892 RepID=UPI00159F2943
EVEPDVDPAAPPIFFGRISALTPANAATDPPAQQFTLTPARIPLVSGSNWITFLFSTHDPTAEASLKLDLACDVGFVQHAEQPTEARYGVIPASWISMVVSDDTDYHLPMGLVDIPIPIRAYPSSPKLSSPVAARSSPQTLADALRWDLAVIAS